MAVPPPPGIYVPVPTFFAPRSSASYDPIIPPFDAATQGAHAVYLARAGIRGQVILGSTGEAVHLLPSERGPVLRASREALDAAGFPDYPIIAGTASNSIAETVEQLADAKAAGAQYGLVLAPGYFAGAASQPGIIAWFRAVADRSPIPVLIYHYPGVSNNVKVAPSTYEALAAHPNIVGCKLSHGDASHTALIASNPAIDHKGFATFTGLGQHLLPVVSVGAAGAIDGSAGFFPRSVSRLYDLAAKVRPTDEEAAERKLLQFRISGVEELVVRFGTVGIKEAISRLRGFGDRDGTRLPLVGGIPGGDAEWENWKGVIEALEEIEKSLGGQ
ncbi:dihydrodipicolinate synthase [Plectosphaerella cucumerina]|uniref:Dihydrodipicolinate synthase n=1 Tax=Plectosphaerella cucumerina TaxID=40658 RepID=A0A8K0TA05_9PEZI|nr:dihydrodipicolinate synthase [Plectosphaerella cucumerina]